jgi:hypothetical protein
MFPIYYIPLYRDRWWALVNAIMILGSFFTGCGPFSFSERTLTNRESWLHAALPIIIKIKWIILVYSEKNQNRPKNIILRS